MKKLIVALLCNTIYSSLSFSVSVSNNSVSVPFSGKKIRPEQTLIIHYNNTRFWDGVVCGCPSGEKCVSYIASWNFKGQVLMSHGPNHYDKLILNFGYSPEAPPQDADLQGTIKVINIGKKPITMQCDFDFSS